MGANDYIYVGQYPVQEDRSTSVVVTVVVCVCVNVCTCGSAYELWRVQLCASASVQVFVNKSFPIPVTEAMCLSVKPKATLL